MLGCVVSGSAQWERRGEGNVRAHAEPPSDVLHGVHVHLYELQLPRARFLLGERVEDGRDGLARPAPGGVEVDDGVRRRGDELVEVRGGGGGRGFVRHGGGRVVVVGG